jgi:hypothetical protein
METTTNGQQTSLQRARRRALVTGASSGIGTAFAECLAREGHDVILVARNQDRLEELAVRLRAAGCAAEVAPADLCRPEGVQAIEQRLREGPALDLLVNNAGFGTAGAFYKLDPDKEEEEIRLNIVALTRLTRAALPAMVARGSGAIINVSSMAGFAPSPYFATYAATKAYVNHFTEALHEELRGTGVQVQTLCPGFTRTEFQQRAGVNTSVLPGFVWMSAEAVAVASLQALRSGRVVCVPGVVNQVAGTLTRMAPRRLATWLAGRVGKRM